MAVLRGPCYKDIMGGFFLRPDFSQIRQTLKNFFGRVAVLRGLCNLYKIEGIFSWCAEPSKWPNIFYFFGRCFVFRRLCNLYKMEGIFSWPAASSKLPNFTVFSWGVFRFWGSELLVYNGRFFCSRLPVKFAKLPNLFLEEWNFEGIRVTKI